MKTLIGHLMGFCLLLFAGCTTDSPLSNPVRSELAKYHYIPLDLPDARNRPGSIIVADAAQGIRWLGYLEDCGVPASLLAPQPDPIGDITQNLKDTYDAGVVLAVKGISAGAQWNRVKSVDLSLSDLSSPSLNLVQLSIWLSDPDHQHLIASACNTLLSQPNTFLVSEAIGASKGTYTLKDTNGAKISVTGLVAGPVSLSPSADATFDSSGSLTMKSTVYFGVKRVKRVDAATLITLGQSAQIYDDSQLLQLSGGARPPH